MFTKRIARFIASEHLMPAGAHVVVALSGGADSVALLCVLGELHYTLEAVHCNFHLRGAESDRDEAFVRRLCEARGVPLEVVHFDTVAYAETHKISIEMAARTLRYDAFERLRREHGADVVAVAHHRDDSIETLLLNLIRGTGINGLKGIRPLNGHVVRPLLAVAREDIMEYLDALGQDYVTDSTNLHDDYTRNKIRLNLLPLMEQINPSVRQSLAATASRLADVAAIYNKVMEAEKERVSVRLPDGSLRIDKSAWGGSDTPASLLHELLAPYGFNAARLADIAASAGQGSGRRFRSSTHEVLSDRGCWLVYPLPEEHSATFRLSPEDAACTLPDGTGVLSCRMVSADEASALPFSKEVAFLCADRLEFPLTVRRVERGDRFRPFGMKGQKLLSDYMTDRKFSVCRKERQWVVCSGDTIVWVVGERIDDRYRIDRTTRRVCLLRLEGASTD